jgi:phage shock protein PspC (stress-responsive transcriptional regulator)
MIAGVCGGLGRYFDVNPAFYRVGFVVLTLLGGAGILIYGAALLVMPNDGEDDSVATQVLRDHRRHPWALVALAVVAVTGLSLLSHATLWPHGDAAWILLLIAGAIILFAQRRENDSKPRRIMRGIFIALGSLIVLVLIAGAIFMSTSGVHLSNGVGEHRYHPSSYTELERRYELGVGSLRIDLSDVRFPIGQKRVVADLGIGRITIIVPDDVSVRVDADAGRGEVQVFDRTDDGWHPAVIDTHLVGNGAPRLLIDAHVGTGKVEVRRSLG